MALVPNTFPELPFAQWQCAKFPGEVIFQEIHRAFAAFPKVVLVSEASIGFLKVSLGSFSFIGFL